MGDRCYYMGYIDRGGNAHVCYSDIDSENLLSPLPICREVRDHSPTGFQWGYGGSGPAQLALALLCDHLRNNEQALSLYQDFKWKAIAALPQGKPWELTPAQIEAALQAARAQA